MTRAWARARGRASAQAHEDRVVRADADHTVGERERGEHRRSSGCRARGCARRRTMRERRGSAAAAASRAGSPCAASASRCGRERQCHPPMCTGADAVGREHALVAVGGFSRVRHPAGQDRHLVPARRQVDCLAVNVLRDAPELGVVIVREDADAHARGKSVPEARLVAHRCTARAGLRPAGGLPSRSRSGRSRTPSARGRRARRRRARAAPPRGRAAPPSRR